MKKKILDIFGFGKKASGLPKNREAPRQKVMNLLKFSLADGTSYQSISNIIDISETGLQFTCYEPLKPDQEIKMIIHVPDAYEDISIQGRLVWVRNKPAARGVFVAGVQFKNIPDKTLQVIKMMVRGSFSTP